MKKCDICGKLLNDNGFAFDGKHLCHECALRHTAVCECCGERMWAQDMVDNRLCPRCRDNHYVRCSECDTLVHEDDVHYSDGYPYCDHCYPESEPQYIEDYYYKPAPIFYGTGQPYYGVELEIDEGGESDSNAERILDIGNHEYEHIYCKHDGSLQEGFEIVSHPATLDYHMNNMEWKQILHKARSLGYTSHNAETCGMHIHISRAALGESVEEQENTIGRIIYFFEKYWNKILRFSRRTEEQANRWASRYGCSTENPKETLKGAKTSGLGRYTAVNLENTFTVELRIFRGTLRYNTFIATLQFADKLCHDAVELSDEEFQTMTWRDFVSAVDDTMPQLKEYLRIRGLEE